MDFRLAAPLDATSLSSLLSSRNFLPRRASDFIKNPGNIVILAIDCAKLIGASLVDETGRLLGIYVIPSYRKQGIGTSLFRLSYLEAQKRGKTKFYAELDSNDLIAEKFLSSLGMKETKKTLEFLI